MLLKSGLPLRQEVDAIIQEILALPEVPNSDATAIALTVLEKRWFDEKCVITPELKNSLHDNLIYDKINNISLENASFVKNVNLKYSPFLAVWVNAASKNAEWYIALLGVLSYYFYELHKPDEIITFEWVNKFFGCKNIDDMFAFKMVRRLETAPLEVELENSKRRSVFDVITPDEFYTFKEEDDV